MKTKWWHWACLVFLAFCLAFLASVALNSCQGAQKVASTLEVGGGRFEGDGDRARGTAVTASFRPLAALEPPQEVVWAEPVPVPLEPLSEPSGAWWQSEAFLAWVERLVVLILGALGLYGGHRIHRAYKDRTKELT